MCSGILATPHCPQGPVVQVSITAPTSLSPCLLFLSHLCRENNDLYKIQNWTFEFPADQTLWLPDTMKIQIFFL